MIAYCGIKCSDCEAYVATQADDNEKLAQMAAAASKRLGKELTVEDAKCDGCNADSGRQIGYCSQCQIRACAIERGYETCAECDDMETCETVAFIHKHSDQARKNLLELRG